MSRVELVNSRHRSAYGLPVLLLLLLLPEVEGAGDGGRLGSAWASGAGAGADDSTAPRSCKTAWQVCVGPGDLRNRCHGSHPECICEMPPLRPSTRCSDSSMQHWQLVSPLYCREDKSLMARVTKGPEHSTMLRQTHRAPELHAMPHTSHSVAAHLSAAWQRCMLHAAHNDAAPLAA